jgi:transglutaminase-like putative cysteine protease
MIYRIHHTTRYRYSEPVELCQDLAHLTPRAAPWQKCHSTRVLIEPQPAVFSAHSDYFGNSSAFFAIQEPHEELRVTALHVVEVTPPTPPDPAATPPWEKVRQYLASERSAEVLDAYQFVFDSPYIKRDAALTEYAAASFTPGRPLLEAILDLSRRIHTDFRYDTSATTIATPVREVFAARRGVCQDFAHLGITCLRSLGLAARYVSGYLSTTAPPGQARLVGADASHAWLSTFCPGSGWIDIDPTNNVIPSGRHILLAWGRDYDDVSPIKGVIVGGGRHTVNVAVDVMPLETLAN